MTAMLTIDETIMMREILDNHGGVLSLMPKESLFKHLDNYLAIRIKLLRESHPEIAEHRNLLIDRFKNDPQIALPETINQQFDVTCQFCREVITYPAPITGTFLCPVCGKEAE